MQGLILGMWWEPSQVTYQTLKNCVLWVVHRPIFSKIEFSEAMASDNSGFQYPIFVFLTCKTYISEV
jgi:hypothetical protein